jgi:hypothetical protein
MSGRIRAISKRFDPVLVLSRLPPLGSSKGACLLPTTRSYASGATGPGRGMDATASSGDLPPHESPIGGVGPSRTTARPVVPTV